MKTCGDCERIIIRRIPENEQVFGVTTECECGKFKGFMTMLNSQAIKNYNFGICESTPAHTCHYFKDSKEAKG